MYYMLVRGISRAAYILILIVKFVESWCAKLEGPGSNPDLSCLESAIILVRYSESSSMTLIIEFQLKVNIFMHK